MTDVRVWVGCLACYNEGRLIGRWLDATDAPDWACPMGRASHEETWVLDHEIPGVEGEMSATTAREWGEVWAGVEDHQAEAFAAWLSYASIKDPADASVAAFEDCYEGEWESPEAHAWELLDSCGQDLGSTPGYFMLQFDSVAWNCDHTYVDGHVFNDHA